MSAIISPNSCNITGLALLDHSLLCIHDALGKTAYRAVKKKNQNIYFMLCGCLDGFSKVLHPMTSTWTWFMFCVTKLRVERSFVKKE